MGLVAEGRGLEGVVAALLVHLVLRDGAELFIDKRKELGSGGGSACAVTAEHARDPLHRGTAYHGGA